MLIVLVKVGQLRPSNIDRRRVSENREEDDKEISSSLVSLRGQFAVPPCNQSSCLYVS